jgi:hypothetical protein
MLSAPRQSCIVPMSVCCSQLPVSPDGNVVSTVAKLRAEGRSNLLLFRLPNAHGEARLVVKSQKPRHVGRGSQGITCRVRNRYARARTATSPGRGPPVSDYCMGMGLSVSKASESPSSVLKVSVVWRVYCVPVSQETHLSTGPVGSGEVS